MQSSSNSGFKNSNVKKQKIPRQARRFIYIALALHLPLFVYPVLRLCQWLQVPWWVTLFIVVPVFFNQIFARAYMRGKNGKWAFLLRNTADFVLGIAPVAVALLVIAELAVLLFGIDKPLAALGVIGVTTLITVHGIYRAFNPHLETVPLVSAKLTSAVKLVQISDVHIGSRSTRFLRVLVKRINKLNPDYLCITGDFIDQTGITKEQLISLKDVRCPILFSIGNHEKYEDLEAIVERLSSLGVHVLRNRALVMDQIQFIGIDDREDKRQVARRLPEIEFDKSKYCILLYHRPRGIEACEEHGVDLMLSGHTHAGQIVPFNFAVSKVFEYKQGLYNYGSATLYVNEGTGTWGPVMRVGTRSEITVFDLQPA